MLVRRMFHMDSTTSTRTHQDPAPEIMLYDMISSGTHSSAESITKFMNALYVNKPRNVSLFSYSCKQRTERSTVRGICIGTNNRKDRPQKNVVLVSGLPLQDPSLIGVGLYVAAMLSRLSPALSRDVSVIPLINPKEYEQRWQTAERVSAFTSPRVNKSDLNLEGEHSNWLAQENVSLDAKDNMKLFETYVTRKNKYFINVHANLTAQGSSMTYNGNSLTQLASKGKYKDFFAISAPPTLPLPSFLSPTPTSSASSLLIPEEIPLLIDPIVASPSIVIEVKGTNALDDEQVVKRGEEIIGMLKNIL